MQGVPCVLYNTGQYLVLGLLGFINRILGMIKKHPQESNEDTVKIQMVFIPKHHLPNKLWIPVTEFR